MSGSNCCFLTCIQVSQETGGVVWYSHLFKNFPQFIVIHTVKVSSVVNEAEVHVFLEFPCFSMIQWMVAFWSLVPLPFLNLTCTSGSSWFMYCWNLAWGFWALSYYHVKWAQLYGSLNILWHCPSLGLEWKLNLSSPVATDEFSKFAGILSAAL